MHFIQKGALERRLFCGYSVVFSAIMMPMSIFSQLTTLLASIAQVVPVPWFVFIGAFIEEVVAPIPSPFVMTLAGSLAAADASTVSYLAILALIGAAGKTIGSVIIYKIADEAEDVIIDKFGRFLGISHKDTEGIGKLLNKGVRDDIVLFLLRAVPIMPTSPVSVVCGLIKLNLRTYIVSTFLGTFIRNAFYLYLGYTGVEALNSLNDSLDSWEKWGYLILFGLMGVAVIWFYSKRGENNGADLFARLWGGEDKEDTHHPVKSKKK